MTIKVKAGLMGGTGYAAAELIKRLIVHPNVELKNISSIDHVGENIGQVHKNFSNRLPFTLKDMTPEDITAGTTIMSAEVNPYSAWVPALTQDETTPEKYTVTGVNRPFIGRSIDVDGTDYTVVGFTEDTVTFDQALPEGTTSLYFGELDSDPSGFMVTSHISSDVAGNTLSLPVEDGSIFFVGQSIKVEGMSTQGVISNIIGNTLQLSEQLFGDTISNKFYVGMYELPINKNTAGAVINTASADLHTYIFGEN